jgi:hypothetical protein
MFRFCAPALTLVALLIVDSSVSAATNVWAPGFPKTVAGVIKVKGKATADTGFTLGSKGTAIAWPAGRNGGVVTSFSITVDPTTGQWSGDLKGLKADTTYVIVVQVTQTKGTTTQTIATPPRTREVEDDDRD